MSKPHQHKILQQMTNFYKSRFRNWDSLYLGLQQQNNKCAVINKHFLYRNNMNVGQLNQEIDQTNLGIAKDEEKTLKFGVAKAVEVEKFVLDTNLLVTIGSKFPSPYSQAVNNILPYYLLDLSSLLPVLALNIYESDTVLDMCAAPGGKSIIIAQQLSHKGDLVSNEYTKRRFLRLQKVMKEYIPSAKNITLTNWNGNLFGAEEANSFDKVLIDAPCSSERHVIQKECQYGGWSIRKMKENAKIQHQLLISGVKALKTDGALVYSTCSLSPLENDEVVASVIKSCEENDIGVNVDNDLFTDTIQNFPDNTFHFQKTQYGILILPTKLCNWGPMFFSRIRRRNVK